MHCGEWQVAAAGSTDSAFARCSASPPRTRGPLSLPRQRLRCSALLWSAVWRLNRRTVPRLHLVHPAAAAASEAAGTPRATPRHAHGMQTKAPEPPGPDQAPTRNSRRYRGSDATAIRQQAASAAIGSALLSGRLIGSRLSMLGSRIPVAERPRPGARGAHSTWLDHVYDNLSIEASS